MQSLPINYQSDRASVGEELHEFLAGVRVRGTRVLGLVVGSNRGIEGRRTAAVVGLRLGMEPNLGMYFQLVLQAFRKGRYRLESQ